MSANVANLCSQIQNSFRWRFRRIAVPYTNVNRSIAHILYDEGFISSYMSGDDKGPYHTGSVVPVTPDNIARRKIWMDLKYHEGEPVLKKMSTISKPSRKVFASVLELKAIASARRASPLLRPQGVGHITILKTKYGILELKDALSKEVGGEVLWFEPARAKPIGFQVQRRNHLAKLSLKIIFAPTQDRTGDLIRVKDTSYH
ncbi:ribosomal protein S8 [Polychytrium aggregatum]|uniref:ribosomal protein S8 n=1 Tax=Polychytrium aggregatum TaxID=110093 RepID=UPI0022FE608C|nr:ribosomal protein S8 [Polychytrium aggregatum]KAI9208253.1 ribosomal protein S8 [Polychytrium aggregatum]